jgi:Spy/CpxP family protein refolding chaperone
MSGAAPFTRPPAWVPIVVLSVTALAGALVGVALDRTVLSPRMALAPGFPGPPTMQGTPAMRRAFVERLSHHLDLTPAQRVEVEALIERELPRVRETVDSVRQLFERRMAEPRAQMARILTPEQMKKFEALQLTPPTPMP